MLGEKCGCGEAGDACITRAEESENFLEQLMNRNSFIEKGGVLGVYSSFCDTS